MIIVIIYAFNITFLGSQEQDSYQINDDWNEYDLLTD